MGHIFAAAFFDVNKDADVVTKSVVQKGGLWMWLGVWFTIEFTINWYSGHKGLLASAVVKGWRAGSERFWGEFVFSEKLGAECQEFGFDANSRCLGEPLGWRCSVGG
jgi:hypothetical protein